MVKLPIKMVINIRWGLLSFTILRLGTFILRTTTSLKMMITRRLRIMSTSCRIIISLVLLLSPLATVSPTILLIPPYSKYLKFLFYLSHFSTFFFSHFLPTIYKPPAWICHYHYLTYHPYTITANHKTNQKQTSSF